MNDLLNPASIVVVSGPTGVGKTRVAVELCRRFSGEIVGADSVQVYREFDIGSNKPSAEELQGVPHHLLDVAAPTEAIDAARYAALADAAIAGVNARGNVAFVVGGTGLWLRALLRGLVSVPGVDAALRAELEQAFTVQGAQALHARLREVDPRTADQVHPSDKLRVVRALEVHAQTGQALGELRAQHALGQPRYRALMLVLDAPIDAWMTAIETRARTMFARGFTDEVRGLCARYGAEIKPLRAVGYRQVVEGMARGEDAGETQARVVRATRLYGKRQRNWFRTDPSVDLREDARALTPATLQRIASHLHRG